MKKGKIYYLKGLIHIHDSDICAWAKHFRKSITQFMKDLARAGWKQGMDKHGDYEYWEM